MSTVTEYTDTGNVLTNAVQNIVRIMEDHSEEYSARKVLNYDDLLINGDGIIAVVFDRAVPVPISLGNGRGNGLGGSATCNSSKMNVSLNVYMYLEALKLSRADPMIIQRLGTATQVLYDNRSVYGLCDSEPMVVNEASMIGRRVNSEVFRTGLISLTLPIRFSSQGN